MKNQEVEKPILVFIKNAETTTHKIRIPKQAIDMLGSKYSMELFSNKIILKPIENKKG